MHCFNCLEGLKQTRHDYQICSGEIHLSLVSSVLSAVLDRHNFCTNLYLFLHRWRQEVNPNKRGSQWKWSEMPLVNCMDREVRREFVWQGFFFLFSNVRLPSSGWPWKKICFCTSGAGGEKELSVVDSLSFGPLLFQDDQLGARWAGVLFWAAEGRCPVAGLGLRAAMFKPDPSSRISFTPSPVLSVPKGQTCGTRSPFSSNNFSFVWNSNEHNFLWSNWAYLSRFLSPEVMGILNG